MSIFKCKMCGGSIEFEPGAGVGVCDSCGTKQTLPRLDDDRRANLYDRANHFRRNNEFDKAAGIYEKILTEDTADAEAYWSLVLCRYGIEYVEDPATKKRVPTVNRAQFTSIFDDDNYKSALQYADGYQRAIYEAEANAINEIQKGILAISQKEEPFDVFICYKETDQNGRRTPDSVLANDLYHQLTQEGFKVFFSRITLEDKLGTAYEPYIFAALNSAKVMVALGTKPEYFNAVWVKNEWSRYLALVKQSGGKKILIPAYKDMDPYDLPEEFSHLQAQDMSKLGFMQDLIRGIKKIVKTDEPKAAVKETVVVGAGNANAAPLLKRAFMFLEDGEWAKADDFCEQVLNLDPENAQAYLGKLMAELHVKTQEGLKDCEQPFDGCNSYQKALRFADVPLASTLKGYIAHINDRNENARQTVIYDSAIQTMRAAVTEKEFRKAVSGFQSIPGFKDSDSLVKECLEKAEECRKNELLYSAKSQMQEHSVAGCETAIETLKTISGWKNADELIEVCRTTIEEIREERKQKEEEKKAEAEKHKKRIIKLASMVSSVVVACIVFVIVLTTVIIPKQKFNKAMSLLDSGDYDAGYALLEEIGDSDAIASSKYDRAVALIDSGDYDAGYALLEEIGDSDAIASSRYDRAVALIDSGDYEAAYVLLSGLDYLDSADKRKMIEESDVWMKICPVGGTFFFGAYEQDNNKSNGKENIEWLVLAKEGNKALLISRYALDCQRYNTSYTDTTWETCSLRKWLNGTFLSAAFSLDEQNSIIDSTITADKNPSYNTSPGNNTTDKVFLLSIYEVEKYLSSDDARKCAATNYTITQGAWTNGNFKIDGRDTYWWWLRSPGSISRVAALIDIDGAVKTFGANIDDDSGAVRPALWINLES